HVCNTSNAVQSLNSVHILLFSCPLFSYSILLLFLVFVFFFFFFFSSRRRHTRSVSAFLLNRSSDLYSGYRWRLLRDGRRWRSPSFSIASWPCYRSEERRVGKECRCRWSAYHEKKKWKM